MSDQINKPKSSDYIRDYRLFKYRNYSMYGSNSEVCGRRCLKIVNSSIWSKCKCNLQNSFKNKVINL